MSLSDLARALAAPVSGGGAGEESAALSAQREARSELARALASLGQPTRALATFTRADLTRGAALLRARVLSTTGGEQGPARAPSNDLFDAVMRPVRGEWDASLAASRAVPAKSPDGSWRAFVLLTRSDRTLLSLLYASAQASGNDLSAVDDVARALLAMRQAEQLRTPARPERAARPSLATPAGASDPRTLEADDAARTESVEREADSAQAPWLSRSDSYAPRAYGSATQFAARVVSSYRSLLPPAPSTPSSAPSARTSGVGMASLAPSDPNSELVSQARFSAAQALGLSSLVAQLNERVQVGPRSRRKNKLHDADGHKLSAQAADQDDEHDASRRARWHELFRRRRAQRRANTR